MLDIWRFLFLFNYQRFRILLTLNQVLFPLCLFGRTDVLRRLQIVIVFRFRFLLKFRTGPRPRFTAIVEHVL